MATNDEPQENLRQLEAKSLAAHATLNLPETRWRDKQVFLEGRGYMLRPRYHPDWTPSWQKDPTLNPRRCEDYLFSRLLMNLVDAKRMSDGALVYIKRVQRSSNEANIALIFNSQSLRQDPRNHCVPIYDYFPDPEDEAISYIVMPYLHPIDEPPFQLVSEVVDFVDQTLVGLVFMHEQGVAHRDCAKKNIMMDANDLYPRGFHPVYTHLLPDASREAPQLPRWTKRMKYFYIDFGISSHIPPDSPEKLVLGEDGLERGVPELSSEVPYDPFKVDIFILGALFTKEFDEKFQNVAFLRSLITSMTALDPKDRPNAAQALEMWKKVSKRMFLLNRAWRLRPKDEPLTRLVLRDLHHTAHLVPWIYARAEAHISDLLSRSKRSTST